MFRPSAMQCKAFENTNVDIPFAQYGQPYETLLVEFPEDYRNEKKKEGKKCPKYVISWYDKSLGIIMVTCQFDSMNDRITGLLTLKPEHETIEELLSSPVYYESDGTKAEDIEDFQTAQTFERIAINLNLLMMYGDQKHTTKHLDSDHYKRYRELKKKYEKQRNKEALKGLQGFHAGQIDEIRFEEELAQNIGFRVCLTPETLNLPQGGTHASPKPHWRRGHWCQQPYGPKSSLRKPLLRPPVFVVGRDYKGIDIDIEKTSVTYTQKGEYYEPRTNT